MLDAITIHDIKFHIMYENKYVSPEYKLLNINQKNHAFIKIKTAFGYDQVRNKEFNFCLQSYKNNQNEFQLQKQIIRMPPKLLGIFDPFKQLGFF
jgi:hypothetical protein